MTNRVNNNQNYVMKKKKKINFINLNLNKTYIQKLQTKILKQINHKKKYIYIYNLNAKLPVPTSSTKLCLLDKFGKYAQIKEKCYFLRQNNSMNNQKKNTQKYLSKKLFFFLTCIEKKIKKEKKITSTYRCLSGS